MRMLVWIAPLIAAACMSCAGGGDEIAKPEVVKSADIVREDVGVTSRYFDVDNPYTLRRAAESLETAAVQSAVQEFEALGYACEPRQSFVAEGEGANGTHVEIVALSLSMSAPAEEDEEDENDGEGADVVYILDIRAGEWEWVVPLRISFVGEPSGGDAYRFGEGVWIALAGEPQGLAGCAAAAKLPWSGWLECVAARTLAGALTCAWTCRFAAGNYLPCLGVCTEGYAMFALIYCTIQQL